MVVGVLAFASAEGPGRASALSPPKALSTARPRASQLLSGFDPLVNELQDGKLVAPLEEGRRAELTLDPGLQKHVAAVLRRYEVPYGAVVALRPDDGRLLAYVSHSSANPQAGDLVRDPTPPAASVFKVVTAAALIDAKVKPGADVCYSGGFRRLHAGDLDDNRARDRACANLSEALGGSINTVFAKLADRHLDASTLGRYAGAFGFGHALPFDVPTRPSPTEVPAARLEFARTAAGFWHNHMSPLHGALLAATIANDGVMARPTMIQRVLASDGTVLRKHEPSDFRSVIGRDTARTVGKMMRRTVSHGTARSAFYDPKGQPFLPGISVAGKTGSLSSERPYRAYSWWVGFAPADKPEIAVAALVVNTPKWRIKGSYLARETLRYHLVQRKAELAKERRRRARQLVEAAKVAEAAKAAAAAKAVAPIETAQPAAPAR